MAMEAPAVPDLQHLTLPDKPDCRIAYTYRTIHQSRSDDVVWLVFVNGLGLPQAFWQPSLQILEDALAASDSEPISAKIVATTYDRYGQGFSKIADNGSPKKHDLVDAANDLDKVLSQLRDIHKVELSEARMLLVAHSIGVPLARLFLERKTPSRSSVVGAIFLDSNIANVNMVDFLPDPTTPDFDVTKLPADTTIDQLKFARMMYERMFAPSAPNPENLDRSNLPELLPHADQPSLAIASSPEFLLTVVAHDPETFAAESLKISPRGLTDRYVELAWQRYNLGLLNLSGKDREPRDIVVATGAAHFIQRDNPQVVAGEIQKMLVKICEV